MKRGFCLIFALHCVLAVFAQREPRLPTSRSAYATPAFPVPSRTPDREQLAQIRRKYGMFIHFGINTFCDEEWTDGTRPPSVYRPAMIDADQWIATAKAAGMKYVILVTKHEDGFCLWDSRYTDYDVAGYQQLFADTRAGRDPGSLHVFGQPCLRRQYHG